MNIPQIITRLIKSRPNLSALVYLALVGAGFLIAIVTATQIVERYQVLSASDEMLARLKGAAPHSLQSSSRDGALKASPFLTGSTITVASAGLLQRVAGLITAAGGTIASSEVEPQNAQGKNGYVRVTVNCELEQAKLQQLLYDIEAGMPFLFIEQLVAQGPQPENPRMRLVIEISGVWPGAK
jgi:general secretion pathway protein M